VKKLLIVLVSLTTCSLTTLQAQEGGANREDHAVATFAGGCFWCVEEAFDKVEGVIATTSGYTGGDVSSPTYEQVSAGGTGHYEAVSVIYDPDKISYGQLLQTFWRNIDPVDAGGQFCDRGSSYRSAIFYENAKQKRLAEQSKQALEASGRFDQPIATEIIPVSQFWRAEDYHQNYYEKNSLRYKYYKWSCGRAQRLEEIWGEQQASS
jgi:peptide-methionine (S)-S-oxide reductase